TKYLAIALWRKTFWFTDERVDRSQLPGLNDLNLDLLRRYILMAETDAGEAIRAFRQEI
ncbi:MAG: hypothetical protein HWQ41_33020, partial [Nostoc sp. NOS(2021)]|nr:hypothetical protein [Nostoc sp. NOS(2021)]